MFKCVKITSFFILLFELLPDTTSTVSGDCDFLRSCVNYKYRKKNIPTRPWTTLSCSNSPLSQCSINIIYPDQIDNEPRRLNFFDYTNTSCA